MLFPPIKPREPGLKEGKRGWSSQSALTNFGSHHSVRGRGSEVRSAPPSISPGRAVE